MPLKYLERSPTEEEKAFIEDEVILRRFSNAQKDFFSQISTDYFRNGISCNRNIFLEMPSHALYSSMEADTICVHINKSGTHTLIYTTPAFLKKECHIDGRIAKAVYSPLPCNVSHCDIIFLPSILDLGKQQVREVKLFLASLFRKFDY